MTAAGDKGSGTPDSYTRNGVRPPGGTILVRGGTVVDVGGRAEADVLCVDGEIVSVGRGLSCPADADLIEADGLLILPGGIDVHTHFDQPVPGARSADDFASGGEAAAAGGITSHIDMCFQSPGQSLMDAAEEWHSLARDRAVLDYSLHLVLVDPGTGLADIPKAVEAGLPSIKLFMAYPHLMVEDDQLFEAFRACARAGALPLVHCENGKVIERLAATLIEAGSTDPRFHASARPAWLEAEAVERCLALARLAQTPVHVVHVSSRVALAAVERARSRGWPVTAETEPHYLVLSDDVYAESGFGPARYVCSPPLRAKDDQVALWSALARGSLDMVASDHLPFHLADRRRLGEFDFRLIPNGIGGIEHLRSVLWDRGVRSGRISAERFVALTATAPAARFGFARKGRIAVGCDGDLVVWDPDLQTTVGPSTVHSRTDYQLYEGHTFTGGARCTFRRGELLWDGTRTVAAHGSGRFVPRFLQNSNSTPSRQQKDSQVEEGADV